MKDDLLTIEELLYGMMLPSGNDAAVALAMYFGSLLITKGQIDPNTHLTEINENVVQERMDGYRNGTFPRKVSPTETSDQRRRRF